MRYNNWENDPFSLSDPCNAISARCDLEPQHPSAFGGIDSKVTSKELIEKMEAQGISGLFDLSLRKNVKLKKKNFFFFGLQDPLFMVNRCFHGEQNGKISLMMVVLKRLISIGKFFVCNWESLGLLDEIYLKILLE